MIQLFFNETDKRVVAAIRAKGPALTTGVEGAMDRMMLKLQRHIQRDKLSGQVLKQRSGKLIGSVIKEPTENRSGVITGRVSAAAGPAWYGKLHERGGTFTAQRRGAKSKPYTITFPERSFMRSALSDMQGEIVAALRAAAAKAIKP